MENIEPIWVSLVKSIRWEQNALSLFSWRTKHLFNNLALKVQTV